MKSLHRCPSCQTPLTMERHPDSPNGYVLLFCMSGRCPSEAASNNGASGPTEKEAYQSLVRLIDEEIENTLEEIPPESPEDRADRLRLAKEDYKFQRDGDR